MAVVIDETIGRELLTVGRWRRQRGVVGVCLANRGRHERKARGKSRVVDTIGEKMVGDIPNRLRDNSRTAAKDDFMIVGLLHDKLGSSGESEVGFRVGLWGKTERVQAGRTWIVVLFDKELESSFHVFLQRNDSGKVTDERIVNRLLGDGMSALMVFPTKESTRRDRSRVENFRKIRLPGKYKANLDGRVVVTFSIEIVRDVRSLGLVAAGRTATTRLVGRRARFPFTRGICVIGRTHNLLEPDNTCTRDDLYTSNISFVVWGQWRYL